MTPIEDIARTWANKYLASRRPLPVPAGEIDVREANAVDNAERFFLDLAQSAAAKVARESGDKQPPTPAAVRRMAAAIAAEVIAGDESQLRVDRTVLTNLTDH